MPLPEVPWALHSFSSLEFCCPSALPQISTRPNMSVSNCHKAHCVSCIGVTCNTANAAPLGTTPHLLADS
ncbi:hypothetical protein V5799_025635 [Amblyomma americanum]|uniref:Uncharacterized protein n=1 Tax=Amblyomma americanum TaxID=6943 RepID=A0AAQ4E8Q0_AMBAM